MPFKNLEYLYNNLPARYRRVDAEEFLKRYLQFIGTTLDEWDDTFDSFDEKINPDTAPESWINFWLKELFGWTYFPKWFGIDEKRRLYGNFGQHLARRGTARGIELWFDDFNIDVRVHNRPNFYGSFVWGESIVSVSKPLRMVIEIQKATPPVAEFASIGEMAFGEIFVATQEPILSQFEFLELLKFQQMYGQDYVVIWNTKIPVYELDFSDFNIGTGYQEYLAFTGSETDEQISNLFATIINKLRLGESFSNMSINGSFNTRNTFDGTENTTTIIDLAGTILTKLIAAETATSDVFSDMEITFKYDQETIFTKSIFEHPSFDVVATMLEAGGSSINISEV